MITLLRTILILIIIYYVVQIFIRYIIPALFYSYTNNKRNEFHRDQKRRQRHASKHEGEVTIDYIPDKHPKQNDGKGEYVDYEEVKD